MINGAGIKITGKKLQYDILFYGELNHINLIE